MPIHVHILHALRDSIVRLTLVKLTCPPSEEGNSLNGKGVSLFPTMMTPAVSLCDSGRLSHKCPVASLKNMNLRNCDGKGGGCTNGS